MNTDPVYLFIHLFKTGGTTINGHLASHLTWDEEFVHLGPWGRRVRDRDGQPDPSDWPPERWNRTRVVAGHGVEANTRLLLPDRDVRFLTILRDPAELLVSRYNFETSRTGEHLDFWKWYRKRQPNRSLRRLRNALGVQSYADVRDVLDTFWFVGVTEHLGDDLPHIFETIGVPTNWVNRRVTGGGDDLEDLDIGRETFPIQRHTVLTDDLRERLYIENKKDLRLYRHAVRRRREMRTALGWD